MKPAGYKLLPPNTRCKCVREWADGTGMFYCCGVRPMKPEDVHPTHDVREEGLLVSEPVCQTCSRAVPDDALRAPCVSPCTVPPAGWRCSRPGGHEGPCAASPISMDTTAEWWARRWLEKASDAEKAAMRRLLA